MRKIFVIAGVEDPIGLLLFHTGGLGFDSFDVFVRADKYEEFENYERDLYTVSCPIGKRAEEILGESYIWIGSEDFGHYSNDWVYEMIRDLKHAGFIEVSLNDIEESQIIAKEV